MIKETCPCGATIHVDSPNSEASEWEIVGAWREDHCHTEPTVLAGFLGEMPEESLDAVEDYLVLAPEPKERRVYRVTPLCADQSSRCSCRDCGNCPNTNAEPGVPVCRSCIDNCDLSEPSLLDGVAQVMTVTLAHGHDPDEIAPLVLTSVRRHVEALPPMLLEAGTVGWLDRRDVLRLLGGGDQ